MLIVGRYSMKTTIIILDIVKKVIRFVCNKLAGKVLAKHPVVEECGEDSHSIKLIKLIRFVFL